jgi:hypothetical protein
MLYLSGKYRVSRQSLQEILKKIFGVIVSPGTIFRLESQTDVALATGLTQFLRKFGRLRQKILIKPAGQNDANAAGFGSRHVSRRPHFKFTSVVVLQVSGLYWARRFMGQSPATAVKLITRFPSSFDSFAGQTWAAISEAF